MAKSRDEEKAMFANMSGRNGGVNSNQILTDDLIPKSNEFESRNKMLRKLPSDVDPNIDQDVNELKDDIEITTMQELIESPRLLSDDEHIVGKIDEDVNLTDYSPILTRIEEVDRSSNGRGRVLKIGKADYLELYLKKVAIDAYENGTLVTTNIEDLIFNAEFQQADSNEERAVLIKLGNINFAITTYLVAPFVMDEGF